MRRREFVLAALASGLPCNGATLASDDGEDYLTWSVEEAERIAKSTRKSGKRRSRFNERLLKTERAVNYKMIVRVDSQEEHTYWPVPDSIRRRSALPR
jgi:hypothetical protein